ncbi:MAG: response regulator [Thermodesulfobacteriota bacterium]
MSMKEEKPGFDDLFNGSEDTPTDSGLWIQKLRYLRDFIEFSPATYLTLDKSGRMLNCNLMLTTLLKAPRSDLIGRSIYPYVFRKDRDLLYLHLRTIFRDKGRNSCELTLKNSRGKCFRVHVESKYDLHPKGRAECRSVLTDLTEIKQAEAALQQALEENRRQLARTDAILKQMTEGLFIFDAQDILVDINDAGLEIWGYESPFPLNTPFQQLIRSFEVFDLDGRRLPVDRYPFYRVLKGEVLNGYEVRVRCTETGRSWIGSYGGTPIHDAEGRRMLSIITVRDITAQHQARVEIQNSRNALQQMNETLEARVAERTAEVRRLADRLRALATEMSRVEQRERSRLAGVLHDNLQQMLAAVRFQLTTAQNFDDLDKVRRLIEQSAKMVKESIDLARDLSHQLSPPVLKESGLTAGLRWLAERMAEQQGFQVSIRNAGAIEPIPEEIRFFLFESAREVLFNAVKHSGTDEAEVILERDPNGDVRIVLEDRGHGFDAAALEDRDAADITFGLFSIRERMNHLGGTMEIDSEPGKGCRITLTAPVAETDDTETRADTRSRPADWKEPAEADTPGDSRIRILVVDDHTIVRQGLAGMLREVSDFQVVGEAQDGRHALEQADTLHPDIVLMDVNMPHISGIEATRIIRERHPHMPVIGLSMHVDQAVAQSMREAGAEAYLTKDGPAETLVETIRKMVHRKPQTAVSETKASNQN